MKAHIITTTVLALFINISLFAQSKTDTIKVYGECESCKNRIEKAAKAAGASAASWNEDTKLLVVTYNPSKSSNKQIQDKITATGYDTQDGAASDATYKKLPSCCQYQRKKHSNKG